MNRFHFTTITLSTCLLLGGCATLPDASQLTPTLSKSDYQYSNKSLTVGNVIGKEQKAGSWIVIGTDVVKAALIGTLKASGIFKEVSSESPGDFQLSAKIVSQELGMNTLTLLVRYQLIESVSGKTIWAENIFSEKSISVAEIFLGDQRTQRLREIVFRDNFSKLAAHLNKAVSAAH